MRNTHCYKIAMNDIKGNTFVAEIKSRIFSIKNEILLKDAEDRIIASIIEQKSLFKKPKVVTYKVSSSLSELADVIFTEVDHQHWKIDIQNNTSFDCYQHKWHLKSIFKNGIQIGMTDKNRWSWFNKQKLFIDMNSAENSLLITLFIITIDNHYDETGLAILNYSFGYHGRTDIKFNDQWRVDDI